MSDSERFSFRPIEQFSLFFQRLCTSVSEILQDQEAPPSSAPAAASQRSSAIMSMEDTNPSWAMKLSPAITLYSSVYMQTVRMSKLPLLKWLVWTTENSGDFVKANKVLEGSEYVSFYLELPDRDVLVKQYHRKQIGSGGYKLVS